MNWKLKSAIRHSILAMPGGAGLYRYLTTRVIGTQHGMAAKWFRVFPAHVKVLQEKFGDDARNVPLWCFDSGATPAAGFASALVSDEPGILTDRWNRLADLYVETGRKILEEKGSVLASLSKAPEGRFEEVCRAVVSHKRAKEALAAVRMTYSGGHNIAGSDLWSGRVGLVYSAGTFEHYTPEQVDQELARMRDALRPGGVLSHVMDHRDHRWHADKTISPWLHLTLDADTYARDFSNPLDYHNRWLKSQWIEALARHGFEVEARTVIPMTSDLVPLARDKFAPEFKHLSDDDLASLVTHFVAVKRG
jgi:hypothetical protein